MSRVLARSLILHRIAALALVLVVVPLIVAVGAVADEQPVREGEPAPRTIFANRDVRLVDEEATDTARRTARESVEPVVVVDREAQAQMVADVRTLFDVVKQARQPVTEPDADGEPTERTPTTSEQLDAVRTQFPELPEDLASALVRLGEPTLDIVERETIAIAQELARQRFTADEQEAIVDELLRVELALRGLPGDTGSTIVRPVIELAARPTVVVDPDATAAARDRAAEEAGEIVSTWRSGEAIVREGQVVNRMQARAVEQLGLGGQSPLRALLRALLAMTLVTMVAVIYLGRMQPKVWTSGKKLLLLSLLVVGYAGLTVGAATITDVASSGWFYMVPAGALAMLTALLIHPVIGIATMLPAAVLVLLVAPAAAPVALFAAAAVLISVPLTTSIGSRSDLRSATLRAALSFPLLAGGLVAAFGPRDQLLIALAAGAINGVVTTVTVQGALPFLETLFRLPTVTSLLDLADRNHPLQRELESKALGSYNHSVMVAALTERACRAIGADPLLGSVAALYHDIGKVRQPHFFIENQQGIANPHDELEPEISAVIIQNHVVDGVEMATEYRLPPEVVACIGSHHGTMLVTYFYQRAVERAGGDASQVDEDHFRYKGSKPRSKEAAVLLIADCCEATTRSMAMHRGTIPREEIEATVDQLIAERVADDQFAAADLSFHDLRVVRDTLVESLVGIYHPRIAYPARPRAGSAPAEPTSTSGTHDRAAGGRADPDGHDAPVDAGAPPR